VKYFNGIRQFGFIAQDTGPDLFFGRRSLPYNCRIDLDCRVEYEVGADRDGRPIATTLRPVNE
jgi:cold shock CspA family protein